MSQAPAPDKRRAILDAAITVFARQGFHSARVSDVAAEAGVAYGLVYHYFDSKDQMLNELFSERWALLVEASREVRQGDAPPRDKLAGVANFIIESYRHEPELMKVIIVEVTRAANSFGRTHLPEIRQAYDLVAEIVSDAQEAGEFRDDVDPNFAALVFYGAIEQLLTGWIFGSLPGSDADMERAKRLVIETICDGLEPRPVGDAVVYPCGRGWQGPSDRTVFCTVRPSSSTSCSGSCCCLSGSSASCSAGAYATFSGRSSVAVNERCRSRRSASGRWTL